MNHWQVIISGPKGTPYEGGVFKVDVKFPPTYPFAFPEVRFLTRIYHPNVKEDGEICREMIGEKDWMPNTKFITVINTLVSMIIHPNLDHPINLEAGQDFKEGTFVQKAKEFTNKYAK